MAKPCNYNVMSLDDYKWRTTSSRSRKFILMCHVLLSTSCLSLCLCPFCWILVIVKLIGMFCSSTSLPQSVLCSFSEAMLKLLDATKNVWLVLQSNRRRQRLVPFQHGMWIFSVSHCTEYRVPGWHPITAPVKPPPTLFTDFNIFH